jgi:SAM-dependent methyltransferase
MFNTHRLKTRAKLLYTFPPKTIARKIIQKLQGEPQDRFNIMDIIEDQPSPSKFLRAQRMINFLWRYEKIIQRHQPSWSIDFSQKKVLEIGGGPVLGFAPIAVFFGCAKHVYVEPFYNGEILKHSKVQQYFRFVHADLTALFGEKMTLDVYLQALRERVVIYKKPLEEFNDEDDFSVVLSNAVFEHVRDVPRALQRLRKQVRDDCTYLHLVNFGNHRDADSPFGGMYTRTREEYWEKYGATINLMRGKDMLSCFKDVGFETTMVPYVAVPQLQEEPSAWWRDRYTQNELLLRVALFVNTTQT